MDEERRNDLLARIERWTEWPLTILALLLVPILMVEYAIDISAHTRSILNQLDLLIWGVFAADLLLRLAIAPHRMRYARANWIDVILVALPMLRPFRVARSARALRSARTARAGTAVARVFVGGRRVMTQHGLHYVFAMAVLVVLAAAAMTTSAEKGAAGASIASFPDGIWWAATTVTTVGYGDTYPVTALGRGVGVMLMLLGISLFGVVSANLAAFFVESNDGQVADEIGALRDEIALLRIQLQESRADHE